MTPSAVLEALAFWTVQYNVSGIFTMVAYNFSFRCEHPETCEHKLQAQDLDAERLGGRGAERASHSSAREAVPTAEIFGGLNILG